jgi:hypothetical protein
VRCPMCRSSTRGHRCPACAGRRLRPLALGRLPAGRRRARWVGPPLDPGRPEALVPWDRGASVPLAPSRLLPHADLGPGPTALGARPARLTPAAPLVPEEAPPPAPDAASATTVTSAPQGEQVAVGLDEVVAGAVVPVLGLAAWAGAVRPPLAASVVVLAVLVVALPRWRRSGSPTRRGRATVPYLAVGSSRDGRHRQVRLRGVEGQGGLTVGDRVRIVGVPAGDRLHALVVTRPLGNRIWRRGVVALGLLLAGEAGLLVGVIRG